MRKSEERERNDEVSGRIMKYRDIQLHYNSFQTAHKTPFGAVSKGQEIEFMVRVESAMNPEITFVVSKEGQGEQYLKMSSSGDGIFSTRYASTELGLCFYFFILSYDDQGIRRTVYLSAPHHGTGGEALVRENKWELAPYQITVHNYQKSAPGWYKNAVFYQIFVDRFYNGEENGKVLSPKKNSFLYSTWEDSPMYIKDHQGNILRWDFFGGNLKGVIEKLDYLQSLGIGGIYLNPIFKARSNHKYDTGDYLEIDEMFGDEETFRTLIEESKKRNIRIVLDGVFNHVGADSRYFNAFGTYDSVGAAQSMDSPYYPWFNFFQYPHEYESWWGVKDLPNVNEHHPGYRNFIVGPNGVIEKWTRMGIGGWRLDVADEMPDEFISDIRATMEAAAEEQILIGEVWEDASNKIAYGKRRRYLLGDELHGTMNYPFKDGVIAYLNGHMRAKDLYTRFMSLKENYPSEALYAALNNLGTHDTRRILTELKDLRKLKVAVGMLLTFPGVPCIYYGDEAGMEGEADPYNRGPYPWGRESEQIKEIYKSMIELRNTNEALISGEFIPFYQEDIFGYLRKTEEVCHLMLINAKPEETRLVLEDVIGLENMNCDISVHFGDIHYLEPLSLLHKSVRLKK